MSDNVLAKPGSGLQNVIELTILVNLVNPGTLTEFQAAPDDDQISPTTALWRRFIDGLAWLADSHRGGETVAAICGVQLEGQPRLLLTSNGGVKQEVSDHIRYVLRVLKDVDKGESRHRAAILRDIIESSLQVSRRKAQNYSCRLSRLIAKIEEDPGKTRIDIDSPLYRKLLDSQLLKDHHYDLCRWAYQYSKHSDFKHLDEKCLTEPKLPLYHQIRHYIGRLGSWHRAASALVLAAVKIPSLTHDIHVEIVAPQATLWPTAAEAGSLRGLIEKLDLGLNTDQVLQNLQFFYDETSQNRPRRFEDVQQAFAAQLTDPKFKPKVHAEVLLADYVFAGQMDFMNDDRYISTSKPACVLCRLYIEAHPLQVVRSYCHGNLWPQWSPPLFISADNVKHVDTLAGKMTLRLRQLLWNRLVYGRRDSLRLPDSLTDITSRSKSGILSMEGNGGLFN